MKFRYYIEAAALLVAVFVFDAHIDEIADVLDKFFQTATAIMLWLVSIF